MSNQRKSVFSKTKIDDATLIRSKKSASLRKEKRSEFLTKRRMGVVVDQHASNSGSIDDFQLKYQIVQTILSKDTLESINGLRNLKIYMSSNSPDRPYNPTDVGDHASTFLDEIIFGNSARSPSPNTANMDNCLNRLIQYLVFYKNEEVQSDAAWCITNLAACCDDYDRLYRFLPAVPYLNQLICSQYANTSVLLKEQCCWALGNIISSESENELHSDSALSTRVPIRKVVVANGTLHIIIEYLFENIVEYEKQVAACLSILKGNDQHRNINESEFKLCLASGNRLQTALWVFCNLIRICDASVSDSVTTEQANMSLSTNEEGNTIATNLFETVRGGVSGHFLSSSIQHFIETKIRESSQQFNSSFKLTHWKQYIELIFNLVHRRCIGFSESHVSSGSTYVLERNHQKVRKEGVWIIVYLTTKEDSFVWDLIQSAPATLVGDTGCGVGLGDVLLTSFFGLFSRSVHTVPSTYTGMTACLHEIMACMSTGDSVMDTSDAITAVSGGCLYVPIVRIFGNIASGPIEWWISLLDSRNNTHVAVPPVTDANIGTLHAFLQLTCQICLSLNEETAGASYYGGMNNDTTQYNYLLKDTLWMLNNVMGSLGAIHMDAEHNVSNLIPTANAKLKCLQVSLFSLPNANNCMLMEVCLLSIHLVIHCGSVHGIQREAIILLHNCLAIVTQGDIACDVSIPSPVAKPEDLLQYLGSTLLQDSSLLYELRSLVASGHSDIDLCIYIVKVIHSIAKIQDNNHTYMMMKLLCDELNILEHIENLQYSSANLECPLAHVCALCLDELYHIMEELEDEDTSNMGCGSSPSNGNVYAFGMNTEGDATAKNPYSFG